MSALLANPPRPRAWSLSTLGRLAITAAALGAICLVFASEPGLYRALLAAGYVVVGTGIALHDVRTRRVPNVAVVAGLVAVTVLSAPLGTDVLVQTVAGALVSFVLLLIVAIAGRGRMGYGDVKAGALFGAMCGIGAVVPMLLLAFVSGGLVALVALGAHVRTRTDSAPFTPFLLFGLAAVMAIFNPAVL